MWSVTMNPGDRERIGRLPGREFWGEVPKNLGKGNRMDIHPWYHYISGKNADFPEQALASNCDAVEKRLEDIANDHGDIKGEEIPHWQDKNPGVCEALVQLMLGGSTNIYHGGLMYTALRYFYNGRPGLPKGTGALVESIEADKVTVSFHNCSDAPCEFIVQGGCFGEHALTDASVCGGGRHVEIGGKYLGVRLGGGEGAKLCIGLKRFGQKPSYLAPGMIPSDLPPPIEPRRMQM
jgi:hypothetical protein